TTLFRSMSPPSLRIQSLRAWSYSSRAGMRRLGGSTVSSATTHATPPRLDTRCLQSTRRSLTGAASWHWNLLTETARVSELMRNTERDIETFNISSRADSRASSESESSMSTTFRDTYQPTPAQQPSAIS